MSRIMDTVNRMLGRSVRDLADEVDQALGRLAMARGLEAQAQDALRLAQQDVAQAQQDVADARDALFKEHPDLRPDSQPTNQGAPVPPFHPGGLIDMSQQPQQYVPEGLDPSKFDPEVIEVDDPNDSRFTAGMSTVSPSDDEPLPEIVWGEHDDV